MWSNKNDRQSVLRHLIQTHEIGSQEELRDYLLAAHCDVSQSTLSRDMQELGIVKSKKDGRSIYVLPSYQELAVALARSHSFHSESVVSVRIAPPLAVLKTLPGCAAMVAALLDAHPAGDILGTIAGDDTVFVALAAGCDTAGAVSALSQTLDGIEEKVSL